MKERLWKLKQTHEKRKLPVEKYAAEVDDILAEDAWNGLDTFDRAYACGQIQLPKEHKEAVSKAQWAELPPAVRQALAATLLGWAAPPGLVVAAPVAAVASA